MSSKNIDKTRARLEKRIAEGSYYEAHQQLRVLSQRYVKSKDYASATSILFTGASALLRAGQGGSGCDLCLLLVEVLKNSGAACEGESRARVMAVIGLIGEEEAGRKRVVNEAVAWSSKNGEFPAGDPELHHYLGSLFAQEDNVYDAEKHLTVGTPSSATTLTTLLYSWYLEDTPHTAPIYLARAIFPYLLIGNLRSASACHALFTDRLVGDNPSLTTQDAGHGAFRVFPSMPLLNFLALLLRAVTVGEKEVWRGLRAHYREVLKEVEGWEEILEMLGEIYFGVVVRRAGGFLEMMGSLFGGPPPPQGQAGGRGMIGAGEQPVDLD